MSAGLLSGTSAVAILSEQPADAVPPTPPTMGELAAAVPQMSLVPVSPGHTQSTVDLAWVEKELAQPGLSSSEISFLEHDVPVAVTETTATVAPATVPGAAASGASTIAGTSDPGAVSDPVMSNSCSWTDLAGITVMWYHSYWGFSDNGSKITQISTPNDYAYANDLLEFYFTGSTWITSQPGPPTTYMTAQDDGYFDSQVLGYTVGTYEAEMNYQLYGSGAWGTAGSSCSG